MRKVGLQKVKGHAQSHTAESQDLNRLSDTRPNWFSTLPHPFTHSLGEMIGIIIIVFLLLWKLVLSLSQKLPESISQFSKCGCQRTILIDWYMKTEIGAIYRFFYLEKTSWLLYFLAVSMGKLLNLSVLCYPQLQGGKVVHISGGCCGD